MERRGGCCIARYSMHKLDRIMLKYRPIAPKPPTGGSVSGPSWPENGDARVKMRKGKRKYVRDSCGNRRRKAVGMKPFVTLPLLPETPEPKEERSGTIWLSFGGGGTEKKNNPEIYPDPTASYVTVECVTETWTEGEGVGMGMMNEERVMRLERDTCPGMITDGDNRVLWVNKAYREMVGQGEGQVEGEMMGAVFVMMKQWVRLPVTCPAFTCRVSWSTCRKGKKPLTLPCDVWKMNGVGFAWRLDVKAALCLAL